MHVRHKKKRHDKAISNENKTITITRKKSTMCTSVLRKLNSNLNSHWISIDYIGREPWRHVDDVPHRQVSDPGIPMHGRPMDDYLAFSTSHNVKPKEKSDREKEKEKPRGGWRACLNGRIAMCSRCMGISWSFDL